MSALSSTKLRRSWPLGFLSFAFTVVACSDGTSNTPSSSGGRSSAGGAAGGGSGGSISGFGGAIPGSGGASSGGAQSGGAQSGGAQSGGQSAGGSAGAAGASSGGVAPTTGGGGSGATAGSATGGTNSGGKGGAGGAQAGAQSGGNAAGGASSGGKSGNGGAQSGGSAGANSGGKGGTSGSGGSGGGTAGTGGSGPSGCKGGKVVHFVYFVENDQTYNEGHHKDIEKQAFAFQKYWFEQLGVTFYLSEPVVEVIKADHPASWYLTNPDGIHGSDQRWFRLGNIKNEVYRKLGISNFDPNHRVVNYPTTRTDGRVGGNFGGAWMDGDDMTCIATNGVNYPYDDNNSAHCLGHVAHEFGHVLGLEHEGPNDDCMQFGFYVSKGGAMCKFSAANVSKIKADPDNNGWFKAMPGQTCAPAN